ncbi:Claudin-5 [Bagarius yarrelli]|uniref:Claudin-5 n=1 Tax=Bagarius yarrelli TaxID=175774 RepID=A0A556VCS1_BAGYA|nr:Claudin-5 [Bagarius yarrelli]
MASAGLELLGLTLAVLGTLLEMIACGLPTWKVAAHIEANIVGVADDLGRPVDVLCCAEYGPDAVQVLCVVALLAVIAGAQCTNCIRAELVKVRVVNFGGALYIVSAVLVLVPLCWMANKIIADFYNPNVPTAQKREMGAALYIGWAAAALLLLGGSVLCCSCPPQSAANAGYSVNYAATKRTTTNGDYDKRNYV